MKRARNRRPCAPAREVPHAISPDWRPRAMTEEHMRARGVDTDAVLQRFREDMSGQLRKRWTDKTFFGWLREQPPPLCHAIESTRRPLS